MHRSLLWHRPIFVQYCKIGQGKYRLRDTTQFILVNLKLQTPRFLGHLIVLLGNHNELCNGIKNM